MPRIIKLAKGDFTVSSITVDSSGRVITASSGTAGGGANELALAAIGGQSGTYTANANANRIAAYMAAGGGGGGSRDANQNNVGETEELEAMDFLAFQYLVILFHNLMQQEVEEQAIQLPMVFKVLVLLEDKQQ